MGLLVKHERNGHRSVLRSVYLVTLKTCATNGNMHVRSGVELGCVLGVRTLSLRPKFCWPRYCSRNRERNTVLMLY
jgi:hypothetical protein